MPLKVKMKPEHVALYIDALCAFSDYVVTGMLGGKYKNLSSQARAALGAWIKESGAPLTPKSVDRISNDLSATFSSSDIIGVYGFLAFLTASIDIMLFNMPDKYSETKKRLRIAQMAYLNVAKRIWDKEKLANNQGALDDFCADSDVGLRFAESVAKALAK